MRTKQNLFLLIMSFLMLLVMTQGTTAVQAKPTDAEVYKATPPGLSLEDSNGQSYMEHENYVNDDKNGAVIYKAGSSKGNTSDMIQMLDANGGDTQLSSIWGTRGNPDADNYFDLTKKQTVSAWIYFGDKDAYGDKDYDSGLTATGLPDGMAFVLQDDNSSLGGNGVQAISTSNARPGFTNPGESLGVWGGATQTSNKTNTALSSPNAELNVGAIQNSFALEFGTLRHGTMPYNKSLIDTKKRTTSDDFFDGMTVNGSKMIKGQHMSWNYPGGTTEALDNDDNVAKGGDDNTYYRNLVPKTVPDAKQYYYALNQKGIIPNMYLTGYATSKEANIDHAWRHFTFKYDPPVGNSTKAHISYYYNDKSVNGQPNTATVYNEKEDQEIDLSKFVNPDTNNKKMRWGFTASTGSPDSGPSTFAIVMQEMPNVANINTSVKLYDLSEYADDGVTKGREVTDLATKTSSDIAYPPENLSQYNVSNGDKLRFDYNLNYNSGFAGTGDNIATIMNLPKNVDFVPDTTTALGQQGYVGQITYSGFKNAADNKTVPITAADISADNTADRSLNYSLTKMSDPKENIEIELFGNASTPTTYKRVEPEHTSYRSLHFIDDVASPSFIINDKLRLKTSDATDLGTISTTGEGKDRVNLNLNTNYDNGSLFDKAGLKLYTQVDNNAPVIKNLDTSDKKAAYNISNSYVGSTELTAASLGVGEHTIKVYEIDSMNRASDEITYKVNVEGKQLSLDVDGDDKVDPFQTINYKPSRGYIRRSGQWKVNVLSADTAWSLTASGQDLKMAGNASQEIGPMFFRDKKDNEFPLNTETPIIASDPNTDEPLKVTNISGAWNSNDGILLRDTSVKEVGKYTGQINWNLTSSV